MAYSLPFSSVTAFLYLQLQTVSFGMSFGMTWSQLFFIRLSQIFSVIKVVTLSWCSDCTFTVSLKGLMTLCCVALVVKSLPTSAGDIGDSFNTWVEKIPLEEGMATHSSILGPENSADRGAWQATVHRVAKIWTRWKQLNTHVRSWHARLLTVWSQSDVLAQFPATFLCITILISVMPEEIRLGVASKCGVKNLNSWA